MNSIRWFSTPTLFAAVSIVAFVQPVHGQDVAGDVAGTVDDPMYVAGDYQVFSGDGQPITLDDVIAAMGRHEVVFIGETHDDPTGHALELELFRRAHETYGISDDEAPGRPVTASLEFFERDAQLVVDEYLAGQITESAFKAASRPWPRYETDYRGLVEYAKEQGLAIIAANAPRRYANMATRLGRASLEELSESALATLAPLPYGSPSRTYLDQWVQVMMAMPDQASRCGAPTPTPTPDAEEPSDDTTHQPPSVHGSGGGSALDAQVLWDATMAYWISDHLVRNPDALVLHMVGSFHVARGTGTPEQFLTYRPGSSSMIIMMRSVDDINEFEAAPSGVWGDFVIQTDKSRTLEALACQAESS